MAYSSPLPALSESIGGPENPRPDPADSPGQGLGRSRRRSALQEGGRAANRDPGQPAADDARATRPLRIPHRVDVRHCPVEAMALQGGGESPWHARRAGGRGPERRALRHRRGAPTGQFGLRRLRAEQ